MRKITLIFIILLTNCAMSGKVKLACPSRPTIKKVEVVNGTITGKSTDAVIDNHVNSWEYIHKLETLKGCK